MFVFYNNFCFCFYYYSRHCHFQLIYVYIHTLSMCWCVCVCVVVLSYDFFYSFRCWSDFCCCCCSPFQNKTVEQRARPQKRFLVRQKKKKKEYCHHFSVLLIFFIFLDLKFVVVLVFCICKYVNKTWTLLRNDFIKSKDIFLKCRWISIFQMFHRFFCCPISHGSMEINGKQKNKWHDKFLMRKMFFD